MCRGVLRTHISSTKFLGNAVRCQMRKVLHNPNIKTNAALHKNLQGTFSHKDNPFVKLPVPIGNLRPIHAGSLTATSRI